jgi:hypothetical protein
MSIADATRKLLATKKGAMNNTETLAALTARELVLSSADPLNTIGAVISRRSGQVGDIVRVGRGVWGLKGWYPNRSLKAKVNGDAATSVASEPQPPLEPDC